MGKEQELPPTSAMYTHDEQKLCFQEVINLKLKSYFSLVAKCPFSNIWRKSKVEILNQACYYLRVILPWATLWNNVAWNALFLFLKTIPTTFVFLNERSLKELPWIWKYNQNIQLWTHFHEFKKIWNMHVYKQFLEFSKLACGNVAHWIQTIYSKQTLLVAALITWKNCQKTFSTKVP